MHFGAVISFRFYLDIFIVILRYFNSIDWGVNGGAARIFFSNSNWHSQTNMFVCKWSVTEFTTQHFLFNISLFFSGWKKIFILQWRWTTLYFRANLHEVEYIMCSIRIAKKINGRKGRESNIKCSQGNKNQRNRAHTIGTRMLHLYYSRNFRAFVFSQILCIVLSVRVLHHPQTMNLYLVVQLSQWICCAAIIFGGGSLGSLNVLFLF